jgi:hypothetical protein
MPNNEASGEQSEARRRALEASVAPGADIYLSFEESETLWSAGSRPQGPSRAFVARSITFGHEPLYTVETAAPDTKGTESIQTEISLFGISSIVTPGGGPQVPAGQAQ